MKHYGGDPFTPERLLEEISKVHYSGINWKKLKIQKGINREEKNCDENQMYSINKLVNQIEAVKNISGV